MQVSAIVKATKGDAEKIPSHVDLAVHFSAQAAESMGRLAAERQRHLSSEPRLVGVVTSPLGIVDLKFIAETEAD